MVIAGPGEAAEAPEIRSKADFRAAKAYRRIILREGADATFAPSTSGLATMLWATMGTRVRNIGYRGTQAKVRRSDPTNYLALLNPRVSHIVCETPDIAEALGMPCRPWREWLSPAAPAATMANAPAPQPLLEPCC